MRNTNLEALIKLNEQLSSKKNDEAVEKAKILNPVKEIENSLTNFLTDRLNKLAEDKDFEDLVKANIKQRMSEASFEELTTLLHNVSTDNTAATNGTLEVFHDPKQGKPITETLKADEASATAVNVYKDIDDPKILQSLSYLSQIAGLLQAQQAQTVTVEVEEKK